MDTEHSKFQSNCAAIVVQLLKRHSDYVWIVQVQTSLIHASPHKSPFTTAMVLWRPMLWLYICCVGTIHSGLFYNYKQQWHTIICSVVADSAERQRIIIVVALRSVRHENKLKYCSSCLRSLRQLAERKETGVCDRRLCDRGRTFHW